MNRFLGLLHYLFVPHERNNWRAKLLHHDILTYAIFFFLIFNAATNVLTHSKNSILGVSSTISVQQLLEDTNAERAKQNLSPLTINPLLEAAAQKKAADMFAKNYWAHYSPDGTTPWYFFDKIGYQYTAAGENLAKDFTSPNSIVRAWMNSPKHRANILSGEYEEVGFAVRDGYLLGQPTTLVVQLFAKPTPSFAATQRSTVTPSVAGTTTQAKQITQQMADKPNFSFDLVALQRYAVLIFLMSLVAAISLDFYVIRHAGVFRPSGKHMAHLTILVVLLISTLVVNRGFIL